MLSLSLRTAGALLLQPFILFEFGTTHGAPIAGCTFLSNKPAWPPPAAALLCRCHCPARLPFLSLPCPGFSGFSRFSKSSRSSRSSRSSTASASTESSSLLQASCNVPARRLQRCFCRSVRLYPCGPIAPRLQPATSSHRRSPLRQPARFCDRFLASKNLWPFPTRGCEPRHSFTTSIHSLGRPPSASGCRHCLASGPWTATRSCAVCSSRPAYLQPAQLSRPTCLNNSVHADRQRPRSRTSCLPKESNDVWHSRRGSPLPRPRVFVHTRAARAAFRLPSDAL